MKRLAKFILVPLAVLILAALCVPFFIHVDQFRPTLEAQLSRALGRDVVLGNLRLKLLAGEVTADDLSIAEDPAFGRPAFVKAKSLHVGVEIWPFLTSRKLVVTNLTLDQPEIALVQTPSGNWNFSSLGGKPSQPTAAAQTPPATQKPLDLSVRLVKISDGRLTLRRTIGHWKPLVLEQVNLDLRDFSSASAFPISLSAKLHGGGTIKVDGAAGPINPRDSAQTPVKATLSADQLDLAGSGLNDFAPDLAGIVTLSGSGESDGSNLRLQGKLTAGRLVLRKDGSPATRPVEFDFALRHDLRRHAGVLGQGDIHIGAAQAHLTGTYSERGESMALNMKFAGPNMPIQELEGLLPALAIVLPAGTSLKGGAASANLSIEGPADKLVIAGPISVNNTRLVGFDLGKRMAAIQRLAGIQAAPDTEIQTLSAQVRMTPEGVAVQDATLLAPALGEVTGAGTISASNALDFKMTAKVHASGLLAVAGDRPIPFTVEGTCANPVFKPDVKGVVTQEIKGEVGKAATKAATGLLKGLLGGKKN